MLSGYNPSLPLPGRTHLIIEKWFIALGLNFNNETM
jgi:hypothetical protein